MEVTGDIQKFNWMWRVDLTVTETETKICLHERTILFLTFIDHEFDIWWPNLDTSVRIFIN